MFSLENFLISWIFYFYFLIYYFGAVNILVLSEILRKGIYQDTQFVNMCLFNLFLTLNWTENFTSEKFDASFVVLWFLMLQSSIWMSCSSWSHSLQPFFLSEGLWFLCHSECFQIHKDVILFESISVYYPMHLLGT